MESYDCSDCELTTLEGSPKKVNGDFNCQNNQLTTLEGSPEEVNGTFNCQNNSLRTLKGVTKEIGDDYYIGDNQLLPAEIRKKSSNLPLIKSIINLQDKYGIWSNDDKLYKFRFDALN
jgi:hypothetical protein